MMGLVHPELVKLLRHQQHLQQQVQEQTTMRRKRGVVVIEEHCAKKQKKGKTKSDKRWRGFCHPDMRTKLGAERHDWVFSKQRRCLSLLFLFSFAQQKTCLNRFSVRSRRLFFCSSSSSSSRISPGRLLPPPRPLLQRQKNAGRLPAGRWNRRTFNFL